MSTALVREFALQILRTPTLSIRQSLVVEALGSGHTLDQVSQMVGITRERIRQIAETALDVYRETCGSLALADLQPVEIPYTIGQEPWLRFETCTEPDCERPHNARGLCEKHYTRWMYRHSKTRREKARISKIRYHRECQDAATPLERATYTIGKHPLPELSTIRRKEIWK